MSQTLTYAHILLTLLAIFAFLIFSWFLYGVTPGVDSYSHHYGAINKKKQNGEQNSSGKVYDSHLSMSNL